MILLCTETQNDFRYKEVWPLYLKKAEIIFDNFKMHGEDEEPHQFAHYEAILILA